MADEIVQEFLVESLEGLDRLDREFVELEKDPVNPELLGSIFRVVHTIKGSCGFLGFNKLQEVAHAGESLLSLMRDGKLVFTPEIANSLLAMVDAIRSILSSISDSGAETEADYSALIQELHALQTAGTSTAAVLIPVSPVTAQVPVEPIAQVISQPASQAVDAPKRKTTKSRNEESRPGAGENTIRVDVNLLEKQMNLVSELVLLRNRLLQLASKENDRNLNATVQGLNSVTSELRKNVMKTRMQPVSHLFEKFPRLVRDLAQELGRKVRLETEGGETELDKTLLEAIKDPVTHLMRNAVDHGLESPEKRAATGKSEEGRLHVRAFHEGGNFHLDISDDGAGIDALRVKQKAIGNGLISQSQADSLGDQEALALIFAPGLSTAEKVTNVSGRGVGMDVVKTNIERIGGRVKLESLKSRGTTVKLEIPLTLATIPALTVVSAGSVFAIPQASLVEMICLSSDESKKKIETIDGISVFRFRGTILPLISLREELKLSSNASDSETLNLVVVRTEGRQLALLVDEICNTEEIVIKPLGTQLKAIGVFSGATVLGDGRVALIVDVPSFARRASVTANREAFLAKQATEQSKSRTRMTILLLSGPDEGRMAIHLPLVKRLEQFDHSAKEKMGDQEVVQYGNGILHLIKLDKLLNERRAVPRTEASSQTVQTKLSVVVYSSGGRDVGLEVSRILDIVSVEADSLSPGTRPGVKGSLVVQGKVTELLEMETLLHPEHLAQDSFSPVLAGRSRES